ncbi:addiction module antitoxin [Glaciimonas immobilis]|uniref:Putative CopG family antitoxin n=1 Tax=Glaciimonas immobilis TaxID=728004 RepID=A0A840RP91_9BURK|nr:addiction module antitoxin [Glaciimonas immobilis]MBB5198451.1 putative CopG family antitoxin [Glaciimonas immobilis]
MTITIDETVYAGLHKVIGRGNISKFLEGLARPYVLKEDSLDAGYEAMAADAAREAEASEWCDALLPNVENEVR